MATIELKQLSKTYSDSEELAVNRINLTVKNKDFVVLVGPSGCGKSTTLRMIAGLEKITSGELYIDDQLMNYVKPEKRKLAMVFQNYALFPHMSVADNITFGLKVRKTKKPVMQAKVKEVSRIIGLEELLDRKPKELSGGQKQRVALGRGIIKDVDLFLMDEPLSNLDAKLRTKMREEITRIHRELGATTVYVTHDQVEAMTMATKIVVLNKGCMQQIGTPIEIYEEPANRFVAGFMGSPPMNFLSVEIREGQLFAEENFLGKLDHPMPSPNYIFGIRPENVSIVQTKYGLIATAEYIELLGPELLVHFSINGVSQPIIAKLPASELIHQGDTVQLDISIENGYLFDQDTEQTVYSRGRVIT